MIFFMKLFINVNFFIVIHLRLVSSVKRHVKIFLHRRRRPCISLLWCLAFLQLDHLLGLYHSFDRLYSLSTLPIHSLICIRNTLYVHIEFQCRFHSHTQSLHFIHSRTYLMSLSHSLSYLYAVYPS